MDLEKSWCNINAVKKSFVKKKWAKKMREKTGGKKIVGVQKCGGK